MMQIVAVDNLKMLSTCLVHEFLCNIASLLVSHWSTERFLHNQRLCNGLIAALVLQDTITHIYTLNVGLFKRHF